MPPADDDGTLLAAAATSAPVFALLLLLRLAAPPPVSAPPPSLELLVTVEEAGWGMRLGPAAGSQSLGPRSAWTPRSLAPDGAALRRVAFDLTGGGGAVPVRLRGGDGVPWQEVAWTGEQLRSIGPVAVDLGPLAALEPRSVAGSIG
jgi:hypothetical protein